MAARRPSARARTTSAYFERTRFPLRRRRRLLPPSLPRFLRSLCPCRRQRRARSLNPMRSVSLPLICPLPWRRCRWRWRRAPPPLCLPARHGRGRPLLPLPQTDRVATRSVGRPAAPFDASSAVRRRQRPVRVVLVLLHVVRCAPAAAAGAIAAVVVAADAVVVVVRVEGKG